MQHGLHRATTIRAYSETAWLDFDAGGSPIKAMRSWEVRGSFRLMFVLHIVQIVGSSWIVPE